jgi:hypothetical protein
LEMYKSKTDMSDVDAVFLFGLLIWMSEIEARHL